MRTIIIALAALAASGSAFAGPCASHDDIASALGNKFSENRQSLGLANGSQVFELYVSSRGSWTLVATDTKGKSCIVAAGDAWQNDRKVVAGLES
jgi:hypothetical protein